VTLFDIVHPARARLASRFDFGVAPTIIDDSDTPHVYARYREVMPGIGIVCPAERLQTADTARWVRKHGLTVAAYSSSQLALAISVGIKPSRLMMFCDRAQWGPIRCAVNAGVRQLVVDSCEQVAILEHFTQRRQQVLVDLSTDCADDAIAASCESDRLALVGLHFQLGSQSTGAHQYAVAVDAMVAQMVRIHRRRGILPTRLSLAGPVWNSPRVVAAVIEPAIEDSCARHHFPRPSVAFAPDPTST
jgi:diaminopimelate decarboxylase